MAGRLQHCIDGLNNPTLAQHVMDKAGSTLFEHTGPQIKFVAATLENIQTEKKLLLKNIIIGSTLAGQISKTEPNVDTTLTNKQPTFNLVKAFFTVLSWSKLQKNIIQQHPNFIKTLASTIHNNKVAEFSEKYLLDTSKNAHAFIHNFAQFTKEFNTEVNQLFKLRQASAKNPTGVGWQKHVHEDSVQYLTDKKGNLKSGVIAALSAGTYKWLATRATSTVTHNMEDAAQVLGFTEDTILPADVYAIVSKMGLSQTALIEQLGNAIYPLLGINPTGEGQVNLEQHVKDSLGALAIGVLESQGIIEINKVFTGRIRKGEEIIPVGPTEIFGLDWLNQRVDHQTGIKNRPVYGKEFYHPGSGYTYEYANFYGIKSKYITESDAFLVSNKLQKIQDSYSAVPHAWSQMFTGEQNQEIYTFEEPTPRKKPRKLGKTGQPVTQEQEDNLHEYDKQAKIANAPVFNMLLMFPDKLRGMIMGQRDPSKAHVTARDGLKSKNDDLSRSWKNSTDWLLQAGQQAQGFASKFWVNNAFMLQGRANMLGTINLQGDKAQRNLFVPADLVTKGMNPAHKAGKAYYQFMVGVAASLGIEITKTGSIKKVIKDFHLKLETEPKIQEAVDAFRILLKETKQAMDVTTAIQETSEASLDILNPTVFQELKHTILQDTLPALMKTITEGVVAGGEDVFSFRGILEYARYLNAKEAALANPKAKIKFNTNLLVEIDGMTNGPIIGLINFISPDGNLRHLYKLLRNGGFTFSKKQPSIETLLASDKTHDAYQATTLAWAKQLADRKLQLAQDGSDLALSELASIDAITELIGDLTNPTGIVSREMRKLSKQPTVTNVYGAGKKSILNELVLDTIITKSIYEKLVELAQKTPEEAEAGIIALNAIIKTITGSELIPADTTDLLEIELTDQQQDMLEQHVKDNHGATLIRGIRDVYGSFMDARGTINKSVQASALLYNHVLNAHIEALKKAQPDVPITLNQYNEILEKIKIAYPSIKTPFGGEMNLVEDTRIREYDREDEANAVKIKFNEIPGKTKVTQKKHTVSSMNGVDDPGMRAPILGIHGIDAAIANIMSATGRIINIYDGFYAKLSERENISQQANKAIYETIKNYNLAEEMHNGAHQSFIAGLKLLKELGLNDKELLDIGDAVLGSMNEKIDNKKYHTKSIKKHFEQSQKIAQYSTKIKNSIINKTIGINQYNTANGTYFTGNIEVDLLSNLDEERAADIENTANEINTITDAAKQLVKDSVGSKTNTGLQLSTNPDDYIDPEVVEKANALDIYNKIKDTGDTTRPDSAEHDVHLQGILKTIIAKVLDPIKLYTTTRSDIDTQGVYVPGQDTDEIFISSQIGQTAATTNQLTNNIRMSAGQVYVHELLHAVTDPILQIDSKITAQLRTLFVYTRKALGKEGWKLFLPDPTIDVTLAIHKADVDAAKANYDHIFHNKDGKIVEEYNPSTGKTVTRRYTNDLTEFISFGLTNEQFFNALGNLVITRESKGLFSANTWKGIRSTNIQKTMLNLATRILEIFHSKYSRGPRVITVAQELETITRRLVGIEMKHKSRLYKILEHEHFLNSQVAKQFNKHLRSVFKTWPITKTIAGVHTLSTAVYTHDSAVGDVLRGWVNKWYSMDYSMIQEVTDEIYGSREKFFPIYDWLAKRERILDSSQEELIAAQNRAFAEYFKEDVDPDTKIAILKVLIKSDTAALMNHMSIQEIAKLVKDPAVLQTAIQAALKELKQNPDIDSSAFYYYSQTADSSAFTMMTGEVRANVVPLPNATLIGRLLHTDRTTLTDDEAAPAITVIDKLMSLYALTYTKPEQLKLVNDLIEKDIEGVQYTLISSNRIKQEAFIKAFDNNPILMQKGYVKSIINNQHKVEVGTLADKKRLATLGYTISHKPLPVDTSDDRTGEPALYLYTAKYMGAGNDLQHGAMSTERNVAKGTLLSNIYSGDYAVTTVKRAETIAKKAAIIRSTFSSRVAKETTHGHNLMPQFNADGSFKDYRYIMSQQTLDTQLEQHNEYDTVLSATRAQILMKYETPELNAAGIKILYDMFQADKVHSSESYVTISPHSTDSTLRDYYYLLPEKTKAEVKKVFGTDGLRVHKSILSTVMGQRKYSVMQSFEKNPEDRKKVEQLWVWFAQKLFGKNAAKVLHTTERGIMEVTGMAKNNIVVRNATVSGGNFISNMMYLRSKGLSWNIIIDKIKIATKYGLQYQADKLALDTVNMYIDTLNHTVAKTIKQEATLRSKKALQRRLEDQIARNPTSRFIESGGMPAMVDDVDTSEANNQLYPGRIAQASHKVTDKIGKFSPRTEKIIKSIFLTQDTEGYKALNNAVKMTDFTARYVLYTEYTDKALKDKAMSHVNAMRSVSNEFINFSLPTHRMLQYGNDMGAIWFSKYQLRILRIMADSLKAKPFEVMSTFVLSSILGASNIFYSIPGVTKGAFQGFGTAAGVMEGSVPNISTISGIDSALDVVF